MAVIPSTLICFFTNLKAFEPRMDTDCPEKKTLVQLMISHTQGDFKCLFYAIISGQN